MPKYLNTNRHEIYVDDPDDDTQDLTRIGPGKTVDATGRFADNLERTPGVFRSGSDEAKAFKRGVKVKGDNIRKYPPSAEEVLATDGEHSFPAEEGEVVTQTPEAAEAQRFGQSVAEKQEGAQVNYASDEAGEKADELGLNPRDLADRTGSGKDGALTVKDVKEIADELSQPADLGDASDEQLRDMATEFGIDVDELLDDVPEEDHHEKLQAAVEEASGGAATTAETDAGQTTETNDPDEAGGAVTSDKVPQAS